MQVSPLIQYVAITGVARSGKNTLAKLLKECLPNREVLEYAFATYLKESLQDFVSREYNIDLKNCSAEEKELIRPLLVTVAEIHRKKSKGKFFWKKLEELTIPVVGFKPILVIITDLRFDQYPEDEVYFIKEVLKGKIIHVSRIQESGRKLEPPNEQEMENDPKLRAKADIIVEWETKPVDQLRPIVRELAQKL